MAELDESRRRLVGLQIQKHGAPLMNASVVNAVNKSNLLDKTADNTMGLRELKESVEEAKTLVASRLLKLQEAQENNLSLSKKLEDLQNELKDDNYVLSSKPYTVLNDRLQHMNAELGRYRGLIESLQDVIFFASSVIIVPRPTLTNKTSSVRDSLFSRLSDIVF